MFPDFINKINNNVCNKNIKQVPTLYKLSAKVFVQKLACANVPGARITELHTVPAVVLGSILEEMTYYPSLKRALYQELTDPVLFMRVFNHPTTDDLVFRKCLNEGSSIGKPVLPVVAHNWCEMMNKPERIADTSIINKIVEALKLGTYLHEAGWYHQCLDVLEVARRLISSVTDNQHRIMLKIECLIITMRAQQKALLASKAYVTCGRLLESIEMVTENRILLKTFLAVASHTFKTRRTKESQRWTRKALEIINNSTSAEFVVQTLQLVALHSFYSQRYEFGYWVVSQVIQHARAAFGRLHRRYADALYVYGACLIKADVISGAIPVFQELLDIITQLYGKFTLHAAIINSYLSYMYYRRSPITGRFDIAFDHIQKSIVLAKQIIPEQQPMIDRFVEMRAAMLKGHEMNSVAVRENSAPILDDFQMLTVAEIKHKCLQCNDE